MTASRDGRGAGTRRLGTLGALVVILGALMAGPALADPAGPTNYRSFITSIDPAPTGVELEVVGGDAFLSMALAEGHTLLVEGYFGEPYLRIDPDGTVWLNTLSPARYINQDRYGVTDIPDFTDARANPTWEQIADGGTFAWHDHRIHWMSVDLPPQISGDRVQTVFPWTITMFIDGVETTVTGELLWLPSVAPWSPLLVGLLAIVPFALHRRGRILIPVVVLAGIGAFALFVAVAQFAATPAFDRGAPAVPIIPALAVVTAIAAYAIVTNRLRSWALALVSGGALMWWGVSTFDALTAPVLASSLPMAVERIGVGTALWAGAAVVGIAAFELFAAVRSAAFGDPAPTA